MTGGTNALRGKAPAAWTGHFVFTNPNPSSRVKVYDAPVGGKLVQFSGTTKTYAASDLNPPLSLFVEITGTSSSPRDVKFSLEASTTPACLDEIAITKIHIIEVHPMLGDFSPTNNGRVLISNKHDDEYYTTAITTAAGTPAQTEPNPPNENENKVTISAYVEPLMENVPIYFEVTDPDDKSDTRLATYREDRTPLTPFNPQNDTMPAVDNRPNDNRDPQRSMFGGTVTAYNNFQLMLSTHVDTTQTVCIDNVDRAVAETVLTFTDRYAGDNYVVRATCKNPEGRPFNDASGVLADTSADKDIPANSVKESAVLTAWKRVYMEQDRMFQRGDFLRADAGASQPNPRRLKINLINLRAVQPGDTVWVFDKDDQFTGPNDRGQQLTVDHVDRSTGEIFTVEAMTDDYSQSNQRFGHVGWLKDMNKPRFVPFHETDSSQIAALFEWSYIDVKQPVVGNGVMPLRSDLTRAGANFNQLFSNRWFHRAQASDARIDNYIHLMGAVQISPINQFPLGVTYDASNASFVFEENIKRMCPTEDAVLVNRGVATHEVTHLFDNNPIPPNGRHHCDPAAVPITGTNCIMCIDCANAARPASWDLSHVYTVRDEFDPAGAGSAASTP